jgi:DNA-directed RNA polymerase subunit K
MRSKDSYTKYEKTRIIATRTLQIARGAPPLVKVPKGLVDPLKIAGMEWEAEAIPIDIKRKKPGD